MRPINPFYFERPSDRWSFTDREDILPGLSVFLGQCGRRLLVHGRRRMGKTSLLQQAATEARGAFIYVDVSKAADLSDVARQLLEAAPTAKKGFIEKALALAKKHFKSVTLTGGKLTLAGDFRAEQSGQSLEQVLNYLEDRAASEDAPWTVCLDEFQELRTMAGERIDWKLRGIIQGHRQLNYVFSGSDQRLVVWMNEPGAAFFKQLQQLEVGPIAPELLAKWIDKRARTGGLPGFALGSDIVAAAGPCTGDVVRLAKVTFDIVAMGTSESPVATALDEIALGELNGEYIARWADLAIAQRNLLRALAAGRQPTAAATLREFGIRTASTAQTAMARLLDRQILVRTPDGVGFDSPFLKRWVSFNAA